jgi:hypothetical protein
MPSALPRALAPYAIAVASWLAASPAGARELADPATDFGIDVEERGHACQLAPADRYDEAACASITPLRPGPLAAALQTTPDVTLVGAMVVTAGDWTYSVDILRETRPTTPELRPADAEEVATGFVAKMQSSLVPGGLSARREGPAELTRPGGVPVVTFEVRASAAPGAPLSALDCTELALVVADRFTYTLELRGPSSHAEDLRGMARASIADLHATVPQPSPAYRRGIAAARIAALVFLVALVSSVLFVMRRRRRAAA